MNRSNQTLKQFHNVTITNTIQIS